jgi:hypothetical protein
MALVDFAQGICLSWFPEVYKQLNNFNSRRINKAISRGLTRAIHAGFEHDRLPEKNEGSKSLHHWCCYFSEMTKMNRCGLATQFLSHILMLSYARMGMNIHKDELIFEK